ncbi:TPA: flagellar export protein FliJ [Candidatus Poribacteria bacterium]|nr:flagellar export protein FliJ [Candidatus Poribacteria bacterium]HEX30460.1 flagellar export protein FliJ [Candidatus Poribacteria bacterium]
MRRFNFRLEGILRYRNMIEEQRKMDLARETSLYERALRSLVEVQEKIADVEEKLARKSAKGLTGAEARIHLRYLSFLKEIERERQKELEEANERLEEARRKFIESRRERKTVETLKEKAYELYLEELKRAERKLIDEVAANKIARSIADKRRSP